MILSGEHKQKYKHKHKGIALVSVMGAVAVITAIMTALTYRQQLDMGIQGYALQKNGAILKVLSVETLAIGILTNNKEGNNPRYDYYDEDWAQPVEGIDMSGGNVTFMMFDAQTKFNVNNLNTRGRNRNNARNIMRTIFQKDTSKYGRVYDEIYRWVSPSQGSAAADRKYTAESDKFDKYRIAHTAMISINELRLLDGFRNKEELQDIIIEMDDYLAFLPTADEFIKINVNTAGEAMLTQVLRYFNAQGSIAAVLSRRPYSNINSFCALLRSRRAQCRQIFDTKSSYFYAVAKIGLGDNVIYSRSLIKRTGNDGGVVSREVRVL